MRPKLIVWLLIAAMAMMVQVVYASSSSWPELEIEGSITIVGDVEAGAEFDIIFKFTLLPKGYLYELIQDQNKLLSERSKCGDTLAIESLHRLTKKQDIAIIVANENIEFLSPSTWLEKLVPNKENTLIVTARLRERKQTYLGARVGYSCDDNIDIKSKLCSTYGKFGVTILPGVNIPQPPEEKWDTITTSAGGTVRIKTIHNIGNAIDGQVPVIKKIENAKELNDLKSKTTTNDSINNQQDSGSTSSMNY